MTLDGSTKHAASYKVGKDPTRVVLPSIESKECRLQFASWALVVAWQSEQSALYGQILVELAIVADVKKELEQQPLLLSLRWMTTTTTHSLLSFW